MFREVAGESAFYFDPYSPRSIADTILAYLNDPAKHQARIVAAGVESRQRFGVESFVDAVAARFGRACIEPETLTAPQRSSLTPGHRPELRE